MLVSQVIDPKELAGEERQAYKKMATWRYAAQFEPGAAQPSTFIALLEGGEPKGLCILDFVNYHQGCEIKHIFVEPTVEEGEGIEQLLFRATELAKGKYLPLISMKYRQPPENEVLEKCLNAEGWSKSREWVKEYLFESRLFRPKWLDKKISLPEDFSIVTWKELSRQHKNSLNRTIEGGGVPIYLTPYHWEEYRQELNTLFLVKEERVVGWSGTHTFPDSRETIHYSSLFIHPLYRFHGYSIRLLAESIRRHIAADVTYGVFLLSLRESSKSWKRFIEKRLRPHSQSVSTIVRRDKILKSLST